jgi:hypothetical protein
MALNEGDSDRWYVALQKLSCYLKVGSKISVSKDTSPSEWNYAVEVKMTLPPSVLDGVKERCESTPN